MKNFETSILSLFIMFSMISCSDDNGDEGGFSSAGLVGTWELVAVNVSSPVDLNGDGSSSNNLLDEEICIIGTITLRDDSSYQFEEANFSLTPITNNRYAVQCNGSNLATGVWASNGSEVVFQGSTVLGTLQLNNKRMIKTVGEELPGISSYIYEHK
ncbi:MAG: hypothetical protein GYB37_15025 [Algicola sp.]|nr:hypothetical protein [Algicola sp.]